MSSVGGIGGSNPFLQQMSSVGNNSGFGQIQSKFEQAVKDAGGSNINFDSLGSQIQSAVQSVMSSASSSSSPQDIGSQIQNAIDGTLQKNGIDPAKVKSEMQSTFGSSGMPSFAGGASGASRTSSSDPIAMLLQTLNQSDGSSSKSSSASQSGSATGSSSSQSTDDLVQQMIKQLLQSLPSGSAVNTAA